MPNVLKIPIFCVLFFCWSEKTAHGAESQAFGWLAPSGCKVCTQTTITDPLQHFKNEWDLAGVSKIYRLEVDINNDGLKEVFLSTGKSDPPDLEEFGWQLYIAKPGGLYIVAGERVDTGINENVGVGFIKDRYWVGLIPELHRYGLLSLSCGRGIQGKCQLKAVVVENDAFRMVAIGEPVNSENGVAALIRRFPKPSVPAVQELAP